MGVDAEEGCPDIDPKVGQDVEGAVTGFTVRSSRFRVLYAPRSIVLDPHVGGVATKAT